MTYRPEIDGLRAIAVLAVILCHAGWGLFGGGFVGVDIFFVISGYLITGILMAELAQGRFSLARFYERRARRILPALVVMVLACVPFAWALMLHQQFFEFADSITAVGLFLSNLEFWRQSGYFALEAAAKPLLHTWSLGVEEQFYLLFPLLLWLLWRMGRPAVVPVLALMALVSLAASEWGWRNAPDANFYLIPFRAWELLAGALCRLLLPPRAQDGLALPGLAMIAVSIVMFTDQTPVPGLWALLPVGGTVLVLGFAGPGTLAGRALSLPPMVGVGLISYSAYLWHQPVFAFARLWNVGEPAPLVMAALTVLGLALGWASWRWVETPFRRKPVPVLATRRRLFWAAGLSLLLLVATGVILRQIEHANLRPFETPGLHPAERDKLKNGRQKGTRSGLCAFDSEAEGGAQGFVDRWACWGNDEPGLIATGIGVFGDSHAADKAHAIRAAGYDVLQLTMAGCPLLPTDGRRPKCDIALQGFNDKMRQAGLDTVFLANRWDPEELTPGAMQALIDFWTARYAHVYLFSPAPTFPDYNLKLELQPAQELRQLRPITDVPQKFAEALAGLDLKGMQIIDTPAMFCEDVAACAPYSEQTKLVDQYHMSPFGAKQFGLRLVATPGLPFPPR